MKILVYSETSNASLLANLGAPEYSYFFVLQAFLPVLQRIGEVMIVEQPQLEVDAIYQQCRSRGEPCVFLSFSPPHRTPTTLACPTIPVFAWEFEDIPCESWGGDLQMNWQSVLRTLPGAIVHSGQAAAAVRRALGDDYPVAILPAPIWNRVASCVEQDRVTAGGELAFDGLLFDSQRADWQRIADYLHWDRKADDVWLADRQPPSNAAARRLPSRRTALLRSHLRACYDEVLADIAPAWLTRLAARLAPTADAAPTTDDVPAADTLEPRLSAGVAALLGAGAQRLRLDGVVYCAVLNPDDGRKNLRDMLAGFCEAFSERRDATLLIKLTHAKPERALSRMLAALYRSTPFQCRVVLLAGYLDDVSYQRLIAQTSYTLNTSHGEGQCLPLMEFMSAGRPAVAPDSSAMADYITTDNAFVLRSSREITSWPQDPRHAYRTLRYRLDYQSLLQAFAESYAAWQDTARYLDLSRAARSRLRTHCADDVITEKLMDFLYTISDLRMPTPTGTVVEGNS